MNRKSEGSWLTLETVIKLLIAVICIGILMYLGYKIYDTFSSSEDVKKASSFIGELESKINAFKSSDLTEMTHMGFPPNGWYLKNFDVFKEGHPANQCVGKFTSCLCICFEMDCSGNLFTCKGFRDSVVIDYTFKEKVIVSVSTLAPGSVITYDHSGIIKLDAITELKIIKQDKLIKISKNE